MADKEVENSEEEVNTPEEDEVSPLDHMGDVIDANIKKDEESAIASFHDYLQPKIANIISPPVEAADIDVDVDEDDLELGDGNEIDPKED